MGPRASRDSERMVGKRHARDRWMPRTYPNAWSPSEVACLRQLAQDGLYPAEVAKALRRSESAVRNKALMHGICFRRGARNRGHIRVDTRSDYLA